jgi:hypothetical protein
MKVRIRFARGTKVGRFHRKNRRLALAVGALLNPATVTACVLALWRLAADLHWTNTFFISSGLFSHWQVWMVCAALVHFCSRALNRYGRGGDAQAS